MASIKSLENYVCGQWQAPTGALRELVNPTTGAVVAQASSEGIDFAGAFSFARDKGGSALREMTFAQRGELLAAASKAIHEYREELLDLSTINNGATRGDGKFDIDGATGTLMYYAKLGSKLGARKLLSEDDPIQLTRSPRLTGRHVWGPRRGLALLINAYNFPAWGFGEKAATAILAGMPVFNKPATSTALVAARIAEILVEAKVFPEGVFNSVVGSAGDMLDHLEWQDVVAFTGSAQTGRLIRGHDNILEKNIRVNVEADSVNAAVIGPDVKPDSEAFDLFITEAAKDLSQKAGQKCTAMRRLFVPEELLASVSEALQNEIEGLASGDPAQKGIKIGPVATKAQQDDVAEKLGQLKEACDVICGGDIVEGQGFFVQPTLLQCRSIEAGIVHDIEAFAPAQILIPYDGTAETAAELVGRGGGSLVSSVYTDDQTFATRFVELAGPYLGRIHIGSARVAEHSPGPGTVLPMLQHGGPGRAGGGQELGGQSGLSLYMQRTAVQGFAPWLEALGTSAD